MPTGIPVFLNDMRGIKPGSCSRTCSGTSISDFISITGPPISSHIGGIKADAVQSIGIKAHEEIKVHWIHNYDIYSRPRVCANQRC